MIAACGAILRRAARRVHMQAACENEGRQPTRLSEIPLRCQNPSERKIGLFQDCLIWRVSTPPYMKRYFLARAKKNDFGPTPTYLVNFWAGRKFGCTAISFSNSVFGKNHPKSNSLVILQRGNNCNMLSNLIKSCQISSKMSVWRCFLL